MSRRRSFYSGEAPATTVSLAEQLGLTDQPAPASRPEPAQQSVAVGEGAPAGEGYIVPPPVGATRPRRATAVRNMHKPPEPRRLARALVSEPQFRVHVALPPALEDELHRLAPDNGPDAGKSALVRMALDGELARLAELEHDDRVGWQERCEQIRSRPYGPRIARLYTIGREHLRAIERLRVEKRLSATAIIEAALEAAVASGDLEALAETFRNSNQAVDSAGEGDLLDGG